MKRIGMGAVVTLLVFGLVSALGISPSSSAPAQDGLQCVVPPDEDYPPTPGAVGIEPLVLVQGHFNPGSSQGNLVIIDGAKDGVYCGQGFSTPFFLPNATAQGSSGRLTYNSFAVPADFQLNAMHHIDIYKLKVKVGNFDFCVDKKGDIAPTSSCKALANKDGKLPRTGVDQLVMLLRIALVTLGVGGGALYLRRRRLAGRTA